MIEIKRNCSSSVKEDPDNEKIIFRNFTIRLTDQEYLIFKALMVMTEQPPVEALEDLILSALKHFKTTMLDPRVGH